ncbi:MAG TPA: choice-of-anchor Q domain-containing protein, partial [Ktedonobacterales bacterium]
TLTSSTISDNTAKVGGGIFNFEGSLFLTNSTLSGNQGYGHLDLRNGVDLGGGGGALLNLGENQVPLDGIRPALMVIAFCTIYGNSAVAGGGGITSVEIDQQDHQPVTPQENVQVTVRDSIVVRNAGGDVAGLLITEGHNLFQQGEEASILDPDQKHTTDHLLSPATDFSRLIGPLLTTNPGPDGRPGATPTLALLPGNPAIDAIPRAECALAISVTDWEGRPVTDPGTRQPLSITTDHDQRGVTRPQGTGCDIGAYEWVQTG